MLGVLKSIQNTNEADFRSSEYNCNNDHLDHQLHFTLVGYALEKNQSLGSRVTDWIIQLFMRLHAESSSLVFQAECKLATSNPKL
jgi:hypothetical protein